MSKKSNEAFDRSVDAVNVGGWMEIYNAGMNMGFRRALTMLGGPLAGQAGRAVEMNVQDQWMRPGFNLIYDHVPGMAGVNDWALSMVESPKKKRKVSAYQREYKKQFKALKKKHPKTQFKTLVKRAHAATRAKRKMKKKGGRR